MIVTITKPKIRIATREMFCAAFQGIRKGAACELYPYIVLSEVTSLGDESVIIFQNNFLFVFIYHYTQQLNHEQFLHLGDTYIHHMEQKVLMDYPIQNTAFDSPLE